MFFPGATVLGRCLWGSDFPAPIDKVLYLLFLAINSSDNGDDSHFQASYHI